MRKFINYIVVFSLVVAMTLSVQMPVMAAGSVSVTASKTNVNVGDTVTITVSVSSGYGVQGSLSRSSGIFGGTADSPYTVGDAAGQSNSTSFSFTAKQEGSCTFSASVIESYDGDLNAAGIGGGAVTVNVSNTSNNSSNNTSGDSNNQNSSDGGNTDSSNSESGDSSLKSLVISNGTLSPAFERGTKSYTAKVDYNVTSIAVSATPNHDKAKVSSVSGNDNLEVGENTVSIVVKAENGVSSTYTIVVTRRTEDDPENSDAQKKEMPTFSVNGDKLVMSNTIPEEAIPEDFKASNIMIQGVEYPCVSFDKGNVQMLYLTNEDGNGGDFYVYDSKQDAVYPFVKLTCGAHYVIVLLPSVDELPDGYIESTLSIEGKGVFTAYQTAEMLDNGTVDEQSTEDPEAPTDIEGGGIGSIFAPEVLLADEANSKEFYLIYCMNDKGETGWYSYDSVEETYMRYFKIVEKLPTITEKKEEITPEKNAANILLYMIMGIMSLVIIVLLVSVMLLSKKSKKKSVDEITVNDIVGFGELYEEESTEVAEVSTAEEVASEEVMAENTATKALEDGEETIVEETTVGEAIVEETTVGETTVGEATVEETTAGETTVEEVATEDSEAATVEESIAEDTIAQETVVKETMAEDTIAQETAAEEIIGEETKLGEIDEVEETEVEEGINADIKADILELEAAFEQELTGDKNTSLETEEAEKEPLDPVLADLEAKLLEKLEKEPIVAKLDDEDDEDIQIIDL